MTKAHLAGHAGNALKALNAMSYSEDFYAGKDGMRLIAAMARILCAFCAAAAICFAAPVSAQTTVTADWTNLGNGNLEVVNDNTVLDVGVNTVTIDTRINRDGDANDNDFTNNYSTGMLSYYNNQVGDNTGVLFYSTEHSVFDAGDYFETRFIFDTAVTNLAFDVANVDQFFGDVNFHDGVIIQYRTASGAGWQNLRSLPSAYTLGSAVGTTSIGGQQGFHGIAYSGGITSTTGDIRVNFGTTTVKEIRIRYRFGQASPSSDPTGSWQYMAVSDFTWQQSNVVTTDLSLNKTVSNTTPVTGSSISYTLTATNNNSSGASASGVEVTDFLPAGFDYVSSSGTGSYDPNTSIWNVGTIPVGASRSITINGTVSAPQGVTVANNAEITAASGFDPDSTPNNGTTAEDDYASASFTVQGTRMAGVPPTLVCPNGVISFDWAGRSWPQGSTANNYTLTGLGAFNWSISSPAGFMNVASLGGQHPVLTTAAQNQTTLSKAIDFNNRTEFATTTITLGEAVDGAQFTIFDVDFAANDFADRVLVRGLYQGNTVIPVLTNGVSNYVIGNQAFGDQGSAPESADGNVVATFSQPVDTIIIEYGNHSTAPADPDGQAIQMKGDISICTPDAQLTVVKTSSLLSDPVNGTTDPKAIPGAMVRYCILVTNTGSASARLVSAEDILPADVTYVAASIQSGATCGTASTAEDDDNIGGDETDPWGAFFDTGTVTFLADEIEANSTAAVIFHATIN